MLIHLIQWWEYLTRESFFLAIGKGEREEDRQRTKEKWDVGGGEIKEEKRKQSS